MSLFAVMNDQVASKVMRIELDKQSSSMVDGIFRQQKAHFELHHSTKIPFYAGYTPSYNECFVIDNFKESATLIDAVTRNTAIPVWDPTTVGMENIKALFVGIEAPQNNKVIAIQTFNKNQILDTSKSFLMSMFASKNTFSKADGVGFNIDDKLVSFVDDDKVYFRSFFKLRSIFDMNKYFQEATDQDLVNFTSNASFSVPQGFNMKAVADTVIRSKVTLISQNGTLTPNNIPIFVAAAQKINFPLQTTLVGNVEKIVMPQTKKELKALLDFLDEDIFTSEISQKIFKSNSKRLYR
ncbi:DUF4868 domain-containing protein [Serratia fonticola]|uniref:Kiwa anti-phage protein KwaB-like domain-containing protein n=1 Tax=Serratia fonticola TaxID=47917 RepID=UPI001AE5FDE7|nr:Kiwa anti-phage protein KwaB-like domain-containing protein [Serratia fonticola]MBP1037371.1 DUF4868 domain-containing protein [Serratia fonticola]